MIVRNVTREDLFAAAQEADVLLDNLRPAGKGWQFKLALTSSRKWQRYSIDKPWAAHRRKIHAVCWHGHYAFMNALTKLKPEASIRSGLHGALSYEGRDQFLAYADDSGDTNIGSIMCPMAYRDACNCEREAA